MVFRVRAQRGEAGGAGGLGGLLLYVRTVGSSAAALAGVRVASLSSWHDSGHLGTIYHSGEVGMVGIALEPAA